MFAATHSVALVGVDSTPVRVEVHVGGSQRVALSIVGLPDTAVREARERVRAALASSGYAFPNRQVTVNLSPADIPKAGSAYDLPIALGVLAAGGLVEKGAARVVALGELALDGGVRPARGGLGAALVARRLGLACVLPPESAGEAARVPGCDIRAVTSLPEAVAAALGEFAGSPVVGDDAPAGEVNAGELAEVRGQKVARRALEVAAAGGHHLLLTGPPGSGKTMLAKCLPGILPQLTDTESLEVARAWSAAGLAAPPAGIPPFRHPHHTASVAALVGGGSGIPTPGEVTLAHRGVLFLDELGEFPPHLVNALRQPLEDGEVTVARRARAVRFPCGCQVVAATNPCPCGQRDERQEGCGCTGRAIERYRLRLSGPVLDRFDLRVSMSRLHSSELVSAAGESSAVVRERVVAARERQVRRGGLNRGLSRAELDRVPMIGSARRLLESAVDQSRLTARGWDRVRRVGRTIADLAGSDQVEEGHVAEALAFRGPL